MANQVINVPRINERVVKARPGRNNGIMNHERRSNSMTPERVMLRSPVSSLQPSWKTFFLSLLPRRYHQQKCLNPARPCMALQAVHWMSLALLGPERRCKASRKASCGLASCPLSVPNLARD